MLNSLRHSLTGIGVFTARPAAFLIVALYVALWFLFDRTTLDWHALATVATLLMTLLIQRVEHRDTQALQAKLDELLRAHDSARTEMADIDQEEPEEIERQRASEG
jgi:low affinity Fe/Cu permease